MPTKVIIEVAGGGVTAVYSDANQLDVEICDHDVAAYSVEGEVKLKEISEKIKSLNRVWV